MLNEPRGIPRHDRYLFWIINLRQFISDFNIINVSKNDQVFFYLYRFRMNKKIIGVKQFRFARKKGIDKN